MTQHNFDSMSPAVRRGADLELILNAILTNHSGGARPPHAPDDMMWVKQLSNGKREVYFTKPGGSVYLGNFDPATGVFYFSGLGRNNTPLFRSLAVDPVDSSQADAIHAIRARRRGDEFGNAGVVLDGPRYGNTSGNTSQGRGFLILLGNANSQNAEVWVGARTIGTDIAVETDASMKAGDLMAARFSETFELWKSDTKNFSVDENGALETVGDAFERLVMTRPDAEVSGSLLLYSSGRVAVRTDDDRTLDQNSAIFENVGPTATYPFTVMTREKGDARYLRSAAPFESSELAFSGGVLVATTHGLGRVPHLWKVVLRCKVANNGYAVGDEISVTGMMDGDGGRGLVTWANATSLSFFADVTGIQNTVGDLAYPTPTDWRVVFYAW